MIAGAFLAGTVLGILEQNVHRITHVGCRLIYIEVINQTNAEFG